jgi:predicted ATPase
LIETHSEVIVNRIGHLIVENKLLPEEINVVLFNKTNVNDATTVKSSTYTTDGYLIDWPIGFLSPESVI